MRLRTCTMDQMQRHLDSMEAPEYWDPPWDKEEDEETELNWQAGEEA